MNPPNQSFDAKLRSLGRAGMQYAVDDGDYYITSAGGRHVARIAAEELGVDKESATVARIDGYRYVLTGTKLDKVRQSDERVVATCDISKEKGNRIRFGSQAGDIRYLFGSSVEADPKDKRNLKRVDFYHEDVRQALKGLFKAADAKYYVDPDVQGIVDVQLENVRFETALQAVVRQVDATYRAQPIYHIALRDNPIGNLDPVIRLVESEPGAGVSIEELARAGLHYRIDGGLYSIVDSGGNPVGSLEPVGKEQFAVTVVRDGTCLRFVMVDRTVSVNLADMSIVRN